MSLSVCSGEILGIVGVSGNGQAVLGRLTCGLAEASSGSMTYCGETTTGFAPRRLVEQGTARIPEDRHAEGVIGDMSVWENAVFERIRDPHFSRSGIVDRTGCRGLDEGAIAAVHGELLTARREGAAILLISKDLDEVMALSDRIQVIFRGRLSEPVSAAEADSKRIGLLMSGIWEGEHAA